MITDSPNRKWNYPEERKKYYADYYMRVMKPKVVEKRNNQQIKKLHVRGCDWRAIAAAVGCSLAYVQTVLVEEKPKIEAFF